VPLFQQSVSQDAGPHDFSGAWIALLPHSLGHVDYPKRVLPAHVSFDQKEVAASHQGLDGIDGVIPAIQTEQSGMLQFELLDGLQVVFEKCRGLLLAMLGARTQFAVEHVAFGLLVGTGIVQRRHIDIDEGVVPAI
jgi:hypothetical protein